MNSGETLRAPKHRSDAIVIFFFSFSILNHFSGSLTLCRFDVAWNVIRYSYSFGAFIIYQLEKCFFSLFNKYDVICAADDGSKQMTVNFFCFLYYWTCLHLKMYAKALFELTILR